MSYREWRSICDHVGSPTRLMTMKPHLEFSSFGEALPLVVPIAVVLLPKRIISLEPSKVTMKRESLHYILSYMCWVP